jgi:hypothetical protein
VLFLWAVIVAKLSPYRMPLWVQSSVPPPLSQGAGKLGRFPIGHRRLGSRGRLAEPPLSFSAACHVVPGSILKVVLPCTTYVTFGYRASWLLAIFLMHVWVCIGSI